MRWLYIDLCFAALSVVRLPDTVPNGGDRKDTAAWLLLRQIVVFQSCAGGLQWLGRVGGLPFRRPFIGHFSSVASGDNAKNDFSRF